MIDLTKLNKKIYSTGSDAGGAGQQIGLANPQAGMTQQRPINPATGTQYNKLTQNQMATARQQMGMPPTPAPSPWGGGGQGGWTGMRQGPGGGGGWGGYQQQPSWGGGGRGGNIGGDPSTWSPSGGQRPWYEQGANTWAGYQQPQRPNAGLANPDIYPQPQSATQPTSTPVQQNQNGLANPDLYGNKPTIGNEMTGTITPYDPASIEKVSPEDVGGINSKEWRGTAGKLGLLPGEWTNASNTLSDFSSGKNQQDVPKAWNQLQNRLDELERQNGMPVTTDPAYQAAKEVAERDTRDAIKQAAEEAGLSGIRWSTPLAGQTMDIAGKYMSQLGSNFANQTMQAREAARNRQMQGYNQLYGLGQGIAGLGGQNAQNQLSAAGQLGGLGQLITRYPMDLANQQFQQGTVLNQQDQAALDAQRQEFMRGISETNPWLNMMMQFATGQGIPQQYNPGTGSQLMSGISGLLPLLGLL